VWHFREFISTAMRSRRYSSSRGEDDEYELSSRELRDMARALEVDERRRGASKYRSKHEMSIQEFCRLMEEADLRRRSRRVSVGRNRRSGRLETYEHTRYGRARRRERYRRRDRSSRQARRIRNDLRSRGEWNDYKTQSRLRAEWRRSQRRQYRDSVGREEEQLAEEMEMLLDSDEDESSDEEMEVVELVGL
jgi:hypothetical protein